MPKALGVLHVITSLGVGGAETALVRLLAEGRLRGARTQVVVLRGGGPLERQVHDLGVRWVALGGSPGPGGSRGLLRVVDAARTFRPDVVVGWMYHGILLAQSLAPLLPTRCRVVWNVRCTLDGRDHWPIGTRALVSGLRRISCWPDAVVYNSQRGRVQHEAYGYGSRLARVIDNGVDVQAFYRDAAHGAAVRRELGIPPGAPTLGHVARFDPMKAHTDFLDALRKLPPGSGIHAVMAGRGVTDANPVLAATAQRVREAGMRLHLLGERRDVPALMSAVDVFCLSSTSNEGFPNVVAEAMACELPCVVTDVGDSRRIVGDTGSVVGAGDVPALAAALAELVLLPAGERAALGRAARARVVAEYSTSRMADAYDALYAELAARGARAASTSGSGAN